MVGCLIISGRDDSRAALKFELLDGGLDGLRERAREISRWSTWPIVVVYRRRIDSSEPWWTHLDARVRRNDIGLLTDREDGIVNIERRKLLGREAECLVVVLEEQVANDDGLGRLLLLLLAHAVCRWCRC